GWMAGGRALAVGGVAERLVGRLRDLTGRVRVGPTDTGADVDMGPVITRDHLNRVADYLEVGRAEGAEIAIDGRHSAGGDGFLIGPSVLDRVDPKMKVAREEIFGPVLSVVRV